MSNNGIRLGDLLLRDGQLSREQLHEAIASQQQSGKKIGEAIMDLGFVTEKNILEVLSEQLKIPIINLTDRKLDPKMVGQLPEAYARRYSAIVINQEHGGYVVGMADPLDIIGYDEISSVLKKPVSVALVSKKDLDETLDILYRRDAEISGLASELDDAMDASTIDMDNRVTREKSDAPVIKFIQALFDDAIQIGASDIHIEPGENILRIRERVDGVLQERQLEEKAIASAVAQRLKLMANLNMAEKRLPQDGRFTVESQGKRLDIRLSTLPTETGESVVMRLLDKSGANISLDKSGMPPEILKEMRHLIHEPNGMILVTGPTGSGKTTTLYGALSELNKSDVKIITIEDPVEYRLERINQVQVNSKIGLDFAKVLRSILRQDPDIILVGEIRDQETASIAMRAALTGHIVLATLHTNDVGRTAIRLLDMGVPGYLVASTIRGIMAQRLLRLICKHCITDATLTEADQEILHEFFGDQYDKIKFKTGKGCSYCNDSGYRGRVGVFELLTLNDEMLATLAQRDEGKFMQLVAVANKGKTLLDCSMKLVEQGRTSIEEVKRVAGG